MGGTGITTVGLCVPLGTPTLSLFSLAHLLFELGFLIDKILLAAPVVIAIILALVIGTSHGGCVSVNAYNCRLVDGQGVEVRRVVDTL